MKSPYDIIKRPVITEKSMQGVENKVYVFEVAKDANKVEIGRAIEEIFGVKVEKVNTVNVLGKKKRMGVHSGYRADWKKAIVRLKDSSKTIEIFEGMV
ncbi:MAG: 50S ribosomal protein L23 [Clostridia bacterium]|nr:50S ribosomal protein L23 [Clostridia bacterium]